MHCTHMSEFCAAMFSGNSLSRTEHSTQQHSTQQHQKTQCQAHALSRRRACGSPVLLPGGAPSGSCATTARTSWGLPRQTDSKTGLWPLLLAGVARGCSCASRRLRSRLDCVIRCLKRRSEEHTSELQSLMRISYAVFCLKKKKNK